jgi:hypothetical protein
VHVAGPHRLSPIREHTDDGVQDPVLPAMPGPDWRTRLPDVAAVNVILDGHRGHARNRAFQQRFQAS